MPTEKPRYTIIVDHDLLKQIDDFRFENRFSSRSAANDEFPLVCAGGQNYTPLYLLSCIS